MISFLVVLSTSLHVAIDFGSYNTKATIFNNFEQLAIAENYDSKRITPTFLAFRAEKSFNQFSTDPLSEEEAKLLHPVLGDRALSVMEYRPWMGAGFLPLFIDVDDTEYERLSSILSINKTAARLSQEDTLSMFFKLYIDCISKHKRVTSVSVSVPATFTIQQRVIVENAIKAAGYNLSIVTDDVQSVGTVFALERLSRYSSKKRNILFVDVGATSVNAYTVGFSLEGQTPNMNRLSYSSVFGEGGAFLTARIAERLKEKYDLSKLDPSENRRLFDVAEKIKLSLTLISEAHATFETASGVDRTMHLNRTELAELEEPLVQVIKSVIANATKDIEYDEVEIIGGSSRTPSVSSSLSRLSPKRSLNADETVALGVGHIAQYSTGMSRYRSINTIMSNIPLPVSIEGDNVSYDRQYLRPGLKTTKISLPNGTIFLSKKNGLYTTGQRVSTSPVVKTIIETEENKMKVANHRNNLENLVSTLTNDIKYNQTFKAFTNESQRYYMTKTLEEVKKLLSEGEIDEKTLLSARMRLISAVEPAYKRIKENQTLPIALQMLFMAVKEARQVKQISEDAQSYLLDTEKWAIDVINQTMHTRNWEDKPVTTREVEEKTRKLISLILKPQAATAKPQKKSFFSRMTQRLLDIGKLFNRKPPINPKAEL